MVDVYKRQANTAAIMKFAIKDSLAYPAAQKAIEYAPKGVTGLSLIHILVQPKLFPKTSKKTKPN